MKIFAIVAATLFSAATAASAATWTLGQGEGACFKNDKRKGGAKYCHNCTSQQGNEVKWTFEAKCDGHLAGHVEATLKCSGAGDEGAQLRALQTAARPSLPKSTQACPAH